jgi:putative transposase
MPNSHVSNHVHVVFGTKDRASLISKELQPKLWAYMAGITRNHGIHAVAIGGTDDHVHALLEIPALLSIAKVVQVLKANSSRWINEHREHRFEWQEGYGAFSVSRSQVSAIMKYIANQAEHHRKRDFSAEFALLLKKHGIDGR